MLKNFCFKNFGYKLKRIPANKMYLKNYMQYPKIYEKDKIFKNIPDFSDLSIEYPVKIDYTTSVRPARTYELAGPKNDYLDFKKMSGNEIILNLQNIKFFTNTEKLNAFYELIKRINLPENDEVREQAFKHDDFKLLLNEVCKHLPEYKVSRK